MSRLLELFYTTFSFLKVFCVLFLLIIFHVAFSEYSMAPEWSNEPDPVSVCWVGHTYLFMCRILCCVCLQSGCLWWQWHLAVCYSCSWLEFVGVSVALTPAAATSAAGAAPTHAAAPDTVSMNTHSEMHRFVLGELTHVWTRLYFAFFSLLLLFFFKCMRQEKV